MQVRQVNCGKPGHFCKVTVEKFPFKNFIRGPFFFLNPSLRQHLIGVTGICYVWLKKSQANRIFSRESSVKIGSHGDEFVAIVRRVGSLSLGFCGVVVNYTNRLLPYLDLLLQYLINICYQSPLQLSCFTVLRQRETSNLTFEESYLNNRLFWR